MNWTSTLKTLARKSRPKKVTDHCSHKLAPIKLNIFLLVSWSQAIDHFCFPQARCAFRCWITFCSGFVLRPICGHSALLLTLAMDHSGKTLYGCSFQKDVICSPSEITTKSCSEEDLPQCCPERRNKRHRWVTSICWNLLQSRRLDRAAKVGTPKRSILDCCWKKWRSSWHTLAVPWSSSLTEGSSAMRSVRKGRRRRGRTCRSSIALVLSLPCQPLGPPLLLCSGKRT